MIMKRPKGRKADQNGDVEVEVDLTDEEFLVLAKGAHERNITFNHYVERLLCLYLLKVGQATKQDLDPVISGQALSRSLSVLSRKDARAIERMVEAEITAVRKDRKARKKVKP